MVARGETLETKEPKNRQPRSGDRYESRIRSPLRGYRLVLNHSFPGVSPLATIRRRSAAAKTAQFEQVTMKSDNAEASQYATLVNAWHTDAHQKLQHRVTASEESLHR